jgi:mannitol/fructose-specific phosphotransferase system IIA component (Ntr-type)
MRFNLNDNAVKRIAAVAYHMKGGNAHKNLSSIYNNLSDENTINKVANAHTTDAMQHKFSDREQENSFKVHLAKSAAINRGTLDPIPEPKG